LQALRQRVAVAVLVTTAALQLLYRVALVAVALSETLLRLLVMLVAIRLLRVTTVETAFHQPLVLAVAVVELVQLERLETQLLILARRVVTERLLLSQAHPSHVQVEAVVAEHKREQALLP
jgi:hypothetical protein